MKAFNAPIPGQSLTTPPKNYAWERPPEIVDPEEAIQMHITRLSSPEMMDNILNMIELEDMDVHTLTKAIMRGAVSNGIHTIDVGLIAAPVVHEFIKQAAKAVGLEPDDGFEDKNAKQRKEQSIVAAKAKKQLQRMGVKPKEIVQEAPIKEEAMPAPRSKGLMSRGDM